MKCTDATPMTGEELVNYSGQLPAELKKQLQRIARIEGRSFNKQVALFLAQAVTRLNTADAVPAETRELRAA